MHPRGEGPPERGFVMGRRLFGERHRISRSVRVCVTAGLMFGSVLVGVTAGASPAAAAPVNYTCSGVFQSIPPGSYGSVTVTGLCSIEGTVNVSRSLTIAPGAGLDATGSDCNSFLNVSGGITVQRNGV